jgi:leucyl aminopeptidase
VAPKSSSASTDVTASAQSLVQALRTASTLALPIRPAGEGTSPDLSDDALAVAQALDLDLAGLASRLAVTGRTGEVGAVPVARNGFAVEQVLLVGVGAASPADLRRAAAAAVRRATGHRRLATNIGAEADADGRRAVAEGAGLAAYSFSRRGRAQGGGHRPVRRVDLLGFADDASLRRARITVSATHVARDLANTPGDELTPAAMVARARRLASSAGLRIRVRDEAALRREGFGGLLGVGAGSVHPPALIELTYRPRGADAGTPHVVLVGKGITFDSGGLSLKPSAPMLPMKTDMAGSAAVLAAMSALADLEVPVAVTGLLAMAENLPSGSATRPGDVLTHFDGRTTEVMNTDAEGRLVLADAIGYAASRLHPDLIVDLATLTGAVTVALGRRVAGLFATDEGLASALELAAQQSGEPVWRLPLIEDYRYAIDSPIADQSNTGRDPQLGGGAITAALFLQPFAAGTPWAHIDLAGPARSDSEVDDVPRGATGFGTRLLLRWLEAGPGQGRRSVRRS